VSRSANGDGNATRTAHDDGATAGGDHG